MWLAMLADSQEPDLGRITPELKLSTSAWPGLIWSIHLHALLYLKAPTETYRMTNQISQPTLTLKSAWSRHYSNCIQHNTAAAYWSYQHMHTAQQWHVHVHRYMHVNVHARHCCNICPYYGVVSGNLTKSKWWARTWQETTKTGWRLRSPSYWILWASLLLVASKASKFAE